MADRPSFRDEDRLPWLEAPGEAGKVRKRKSGSRAALVGLLVAFFGVGLAVAFSLGARFAQSPAESPAAAISEPPRRTASVQVPLAPPVPLPEVELVAPPKVADAQVSEAPVAATPPPVVKKPAIRKHRPFRAKAKKRHIKRKPILRPFKLIKRPALQPAPPAARPKPTIPFTPTGRIVQLGSYSTQRRAEMAYRTMVWRYPYLATKPKVISPTPPIQGYRYYRLRLGTANQAQSLVICQQLQRRGQSCVVIY